MNVSVQLKVNLINLDKPSLVLGFLLGKFTQDCRHSIFESKAKLVNGCAHFVAHQALGTVVYSYHLGKMQASIDDGNICCRPHKLQVSAQNYA